MILRHFNLQYILPNFLLHKLSINFKIFIKLIEEQMYIQLNLDETIFDFNNNNKWDKYFNNKLNLNCVVTKMISYHKNIKDIDSTKNSIIGEILSTFVGGMDIMITTSEYGLILLSKYEKEQELIYNELNNIL